jgi:hypothetical protein
MSNNRFFFMQGVEIKLNYVWIALKVPNSMFNTISVISWQSVLLVEEAGVPGENHQPVPSH